MKEIFFTYQQQIVLTLGFLLISISSSQIAKLFQRINLPLITGFVVTGIIAGPYILNLIPKSSSIELSFIREIALAFIAFAAGSELYLRELRSRYKSIKWNTFGQLFVTFILGTITIVALSNFIPFLSGKSFEVRLSIAAIISAVFVARSPASAIAVINELRAKGPFVQTVLGVTVVKDFIVIILFSLCISVGQSTISGKDFNLSQFLFLVGELITSLALGFYLFGRLLEVILSFRINRNLKTVLVILVGYSAYVLSNFIRLKSPEFVDHSIFLEPLLICIIASFYATNFTRYRPEFLQIIHNSGLPIYVAFFTLIGSGLNISVIGDVYEIAIIFFLVRLFTMMLGAFVGGTLAKDPPNFIFLGWTPYIAQAGVALGLVSIVASNFPTWGDEFATIMVTVIIFNQFVGDPLFKWAIFKIGEDRVRAESGYDNVLDAIIVGYEPTSVALAKTLMEKGWEVQLATRSEKGSFEEPEGIKIIYLKDLAKEEFDSMNAGKTEVMVFLLSDDENLQLAEMAYHEYGTRDIIVRINHRYNTQKFLSLNCRVIDPSTAMVSLLEHFVRSPEATSLLLGMQKGQDTRDIEIFNPDMHGIALRDLRLPPDVIILSIRRAGQTIISHGYTRLRIRDIVTVVGSIKSLDEVQFKFDQ